MDDTGVVMTPFGDNSYVVVFFSLKSGVVEVYFYKVTKGNDKN